MNKLGRFLAKLGIGIAATSLAVYADYRIKGGPPIRQLYRQVKAERIKMSVEHGPNAQIHLKEEDYCIR